MRIELILLPITDIDAAKSFYADQLGFHVDYDITRDDAPRVVQLTPPGSSLLHHARRGLRQRRLYRHAARGNQGHPSRRR